jgi:hypothetical protein
VAGPEIKMVQCDVYYPVSNVPGLSNHKIETIQEARTIANIDIAQCTIYNYLTSFLWAPKSKGRFRRPLRPMPRDPIVS